MDLLDDDDDIIFDESALAQIEAVERAVQSGALPPKSGPVSLPNLKQKTLFGATVRTVTAPLPKGAPVPAAETRATKKWDFGSFAKLGWSKKRAIQAKAAKGKGKKKAYASDEDPWDDEEEVLDDDDEEDAVLDPLEVVGERQPIKWPPDQAAIKTWHYPVQADKPLRSYQHNIAYKCLFDNTLVSLPTGLGKTFIAACVMLNFSRWYPKGKIIFLAPTRPLVTQQIKACHYIAGIPQSACIELTGQTPANLRGVAWSTKRVIYCTPQTLENDLKKGRVDPRDIVCLVVDEAHRASGDYAYCGVVRFVMSRNEHFRVLALTATPGARGEAVQDVIDNLHIGHIEVRTDASIDIKQYMHQKSYDLCVIPLNNTPIAAIRDKLASIMMTYMQPLLGARLIYDGNATMISPFSVQRAYGEVKKLPGGGKSNGKYFPMIKSLHALARAMELLLVHSVTCCDETIANACAENKTLASKPDVAQLRSDIRKLRGMPGYVGHPKMQRLRQMCEQHFKEAEEQGQDDTRIMIFCNYRDVVEEIVNCLNMLKPLIKATRFIGQGTAKGVKGKTQKEQIETIKKFKQGVYNVLVATSIGEEGLDIGEIDLIVCYEANKSPVRMLQRVGRTGRARDGKIIVLMAEGREERNWDKAKDAYADVQNALTSNKVFDLYSDGDRMIPDSVKPECVQVEVKAAELDLNALTMAGQTKLLRKSTADEKKAAAADKKKKAVQRDPKLNVPKDAFMGFRAAGDLAKEKERKVAKSTAEIMRERRSAALLNVEEEVELRKWQFAGDAKVRPVALDTYNLPHRSFSSKQLASHGRRHEHLTSFIDASNAISDDQEAGYDEWHEQMSAAFDKDLVNGWAPHMRVGPKPKHPSLRIAVRQPELPKTFTQAAVPTMPMSSGFNVSRVPETKSSFRPSGAASQHKLTGEASGSRRSVPDPHGILASSSSSSSDEELPELVKQRATVSSGATGAMKEKAPTSNDFGMFDLMDIDLDELDRIEQQANDARAVKRPQSVTAAPVPPKKKSSQPDIEIPDSDDEELVPQRPPVLTRDLLNSSFDLVLSDDEPPVPAKKDLEVEHDMLPPPVPDRSVKKANVNTVDMNARPRYKRHVVPGSDSSSFAGGLKSDEDDGSPVKLKRAANGKKGKVVVATSSASEEDKGESAAARPRKKLRRAGERRQQVRTVVEEQHLNPQEAKEQKRKKEKKKVTDRDQAKHNMLDFEAVNSGASGSEASTESYDSENSIDRDFVAADDDEGDESLLSADADEQARFYRESVMQTQHPAFAPNFGKRNLLERRGDARHHRPSTPDSRMDQDDWSYDSFCVRSDEPLEEATSSQA